MESNVITHHVGEGEVVLIAGGGKVYTDIAARFVRSERSLNDIIGSPYDKNLVSNIISSGHLAATEFDTFIFGISNYSRVTETQLVRKRLASYLFKSGRAELHGKRKFEVTIPKSIKGHTAVFDDNGEPIVLDAEKILKMIECWYNTGVDSGLYKEEDLRYLKPQATSTKAIVAMNAHGLLDWFSIRCCNNAQEEIRDMAKKMLRLCKQAAPDLFETAGPSCVRFGYCPENARQNEACKGKIITKEKAMEVLKKHSVFSLFS